jgi:hypothetical protein
MTKTPTTPDSLHRLAKLTLDTGEDASVEDAMQRLKGYRLGVRVGPDVARSPTLQAALLTAVNCARRCFLGGVEVSGFLDASLRVPWGSSQTIQEAVADLGATLEPTRNTAGPTVVLGDVTLPVGDEVVLRTTFDGWCGGVLPYNDGARLAEQREFTPAGVLAGALAVSEAFQSVRGDAVAGRRAAGLSLWRPSNDWRATAADEPPLVRLPSALWLLGLGHLGQAFLWTLGFLPYETPGDVHLVLQDFDKLVAANDSTSLLTRAGMVGEHKTRAMARWCESRGFRTSIVERRFADDFRVSDDEPQLALCGVDNALARAALLDVGFQRVVEAGLGRGPEEYLAFQVHSFPAAKSARDRWGVVQATSATALLARPAYQAMSREGVDRCGILNFADRSIGAPFVGAAVSALVVAEVLRMLEGGERNELIDGSLRAPSRCVAVPRTSEDQPFNPGSTLAVQ